MLVTIAFALEINEPLTADKYVVRNQITIGEWVIFVEENDDRDSGALIEMVPGFTYLDGKIFKAREFSKGSATVLSHDDPDSRNVGVLCAFFTFNAKGNLTAVLDDKHKFTNITSYIGTIKPPVYVNKLLTIPIKLVEEIEHNLLVGF